MMMGSGILPREMRENADPLDAMAFKPFNGIGTLFDKSPYQFGIGFPVVILHKHLEHIVLFALDPVVKLYFALCVDLWSMLTAFSEDILRVNSQHMIDGI